MAEEHTLRLNIDATGAAAGAAQFKRAVSDIADSTRGINAGAAANIRAIRDAVANFRPPSADAVARMAQFKDALKGISTPSTSSISAITSLKMALNGFQVPTAAQVQNLQLLSGVLRGFNVSPATAAALTQVSAALGNFRAPSQASIRNMQEFSRSLSSMRLPADLSRIIAGLDQVTASANRAAAALERLHGIRGPGGYGGGGGGGGGTTRRRNQGYGPRTNGYQYDGILSGENRAVGEMRGFENVVNPSFQMASVGRVAAAGGALTVGEGLKSLMEEGQNLVQFQHVLEVVTGDTNDAKKAQSDLANMMQFATDVAMKYGINLETVRMSFSRFAVAAHSAGFSQDETKVMFENMSEAVRAMGADAETTSRIYRALDQIMQTGHVSMLQLHKEIGLQMPAIQIMARALGYTAQQIEQMSKKAELGSDTLLAFSDAAKKMYMPGLATAINSPVAALERLKNTVTLTEDAMLNAGLFDKMGEQFNRLAGIIQKPEMQQFFIRLGDALASVLSGMISGLEFLANHIDAVTAAFKLLFLYATVQAFDNVAGAVFRMAGRFSSLETILPNITGMMRSFRTETEAATAAQASMAAANAASGTTGLAAGAGNLAGAGAAMMAGLAARRAPQLALTSEAYVPNFTMVDAAFEEAAGSVGLFGTAITAAGLAMTAFITALIGIPAIMYLGRDAVQNFGDVSATTGTIYAQWWSDMKEGFSDMSSVVVNKMKDMWSAVHGPEHPVDAAARGIQDFIADQIASFQNAKQALSRIPTIANEMLHGNFRNAVIDQDGQYRTGTDVEKSAAERANAANKAAAGAPSVDTTPGPLTPRGLSPQTIATYTAEWQKMLDKIDPVNKATDQWHTELTTIEHAIQANVGTQDQWNAAIERANQAFLKMAGAMTPAQNALENLRLTQEGLNSAVEKGLYTRAQADLIMGAKQQQALPQTDPYQAALQHAQTEIGYLRMNGGKANIARSLTDVKQHMAENGQSMTADQEKQLADTLRLQDSLTSRGGKTPGQKAEDAYTLLKNKYSPQDKSLDEYKAAIDGIAKAQAAGKGTAEEYQRIMDGARDKVLAFTGASIPAVKAQEELTLAHQRAAAALKMLPQYADAINNNLKEEERNLQGVIDPVSAYIKKLNEETAALKLSNLEREKKNELDKLNAKTLKDTGHDMTPEQKADASKAITDNQQAQRDAKDRNSGLQTWADSMGSLNNQLGKVEEKLADDLPKAFVNFVKTGKFEWQSLVSGMLSDIAEILAKAAEKNILEGLGIIGPTGTAPNGAIPTGSITQGLLGRGFDALFGTNKGDTDIRGGTKGATDYTAPIGPNADGSMLNGQVLSKAIGQGAGGGSNGGILGSIFGAAAKGIGSLFGSGAGSALGLSSDAAVSSIGPLAGAASLGGGVDAIGGAGFGALGDITASTAASGAAASSGGFFSMLASLFSEGGYTGSAVASAMVPASHFARAPSYAEGTHNTSGGMPAMLHPNEAVIPLSRGRKIPVDLGGQSGAGMRNGPVVNMHIHTPDADSFRKSETQINNRMAHVMGTANKRNG